MWELALSIQAHICKLGGESRGLRRTDALGGVPGALQSGFALRIGEASPGPSLVLDGAGIDVRLGVAVMSRPPCQTTKYAISAVLALTTLGALGGRGAT